MDTQVAKLKKNCAYAWAQYYKEVELNMAEQVKLINRVNTMMADNSNEFPPHVLDEMKQLYKEMKKSVECPICMEIIGDKLKITNCGHKYCENCYDKLDICAICRKQIYRKK